MWPTIWSSDRPRGISAWVLCALVPVVAFGIWRRCVLPSAKDCRLSADGRSVRGLTCEAHSQVIRPTAYTLQVNGVDQRLWCVTGGMRRPTCSDTTHAVLVLPGDRVSIKAEMMAPLTLSR